MQRHRRIFASCFTATGRRLPVPLGLALAATWLGLVATPPLAGGGRDANVAAGLWLQLPCAVLAVTAVAAGLETWPLLSRNRAGAALVARLQPPGVDGCLAACLGTLTALALALAATAPAFLATLRGAGHPALEVRAHVPYRAVTARPFLDHKHDRLRFRTSQTGSIRGLRLSPIAIWPGGTELRASRLQIVVDGAPILPKPVEVSGNRPEIEIEFAPRRLTEFEVTAEPGSSLILVFDTTAVEGVRPDSPSSLLNTLLTAACFLVPAALALALACLTRRLLALPVSLALAACVMLLATMLDWLPNGPAIAAYCRGRWLPTEDLMPPLINALALITGITATATLTGQRRP